MKYCILYVTLFSKHFSNINTQKIREITLDNLFQFVIVSDLKKYLDKNRSRCSRKKTRNLCSKMIDQVFQNDRTVTSVPKMIKTGAGVPKMLRKIPTIFTKVFLQIRNYYKLK
jgi:hypothetical protein